jgi:hypothetical protein
LVGRTSSSLEVLTTAAGEKPIDKTMPTNADNDFDPTEGDTPALARNNKGEVWNQQVSEIKGFTRCDNFPVVVTQ